MSRRANELVVDDDVAVDDDDVVHPPVVERVRVAVRERPVADADLASVQVRLRVADDKLVAFAPHASQGLMYDYDYYYPPGAQQDDLLHTIGVEMVDVVLGGLSANCVVVGYADTGKTYTLYGHHHHRDRNSSSSNNDDDDDDDDDAEDGLVHATVRELFARLAQQAHTHSYHVALRYWEMNRDDVCDNLCDSDSDNDNDDDNKHGDDTTSSTPPHAVFRDEHGRLYVSHLRDVDVADYDAFAAHLRAGTRRWRRRCARARRARWHGFVQLAITTIDRARGEWCVLRRMTFAHTKGGHRNGADGRRGAALQHGCNVNVSLTLLFAGVIHALAYRARRAHAGQRSSSSSADAHALLLLRKSQSFFMHSRFSQFMSQLLGGQEACFVVGCVDARAYADTSETLERVQLLRRLRCACVPVVTPSEKGVLLRTLRSLERAFGGPEVLATVYGRHTGRPRTEAEEQLLRLRRRIDAWRPDGGGDATRPPAATARPPRGGGSSARATTTTTTTAASKSTATTTTTAAAAIECSLTDPSRLQHEEELRQRGRERLTASASQVRVATATSTSSAASRLPTRGGRVDSNSHSYSKRSSVAASATAQQPPSSSSSPPQQQQQPLMPPHATATAVAAAAATHGDRGKIYLNAAKTATYEGQWADGRFDGFGELVRDAYKYRGEFSRGEREGEGVLFVRRTAASPYTRVYEGEWLAGQRDGHGTQWCDNGDVYCGSFVRDRRHGIGKLYCANGDVVEGEFRDDACDGYATLHTAGGDWYEGHWSRGVREGEGTWHFVQRKQRLCGEWHDNVARLGTLLDDEDKTDSRCGAFLPRLRLCDGGAHVLARERAKLHEQVALQRRLLQQLPPPSSRVV